MPPFQSRIKFPPWVPDQTDQEANTSMNVQNVLPRADGWGPFPSFVQFSQSLPAQCFGYVYVRNPDGSIQVLAGTSTKLYALNNTNMQWVDVSLGGGTYAALSDNALWQFEQFDTQVIAVQANCAPQVITLPLNIGTSAFANLAGSPPNAAYVAIVNRFVVLSGLPNQPFRIQWSDIDNPTVWTAGVGLSDFQDLPDGGIALGVAGFDMFAVIFQSSMARLMTFAPGSPLIFTISKITGGDGNGLFAPYAYVIDQDNVFWMSTEGLKMMAPGGGPQSVGKEMIDRYYFANVDTANLGLCQMTTEPQASRMYIAFKSKTGQSGLFDTVLVYDWVLQRYSRIFISGQYIDTSAVPGATLEAMDIATPGAVTVSGITNAAGLIRLTVSSTGGMATAQQQTVYGTWNITQAVVNATLAAALYNKQNTANSQWGSWAVNVIDGTHVDLVGSSFPGGGTYTSGGVLGGNLELIPFSFDTVSEGSIPWLCAVSPAGAMGTFNGSPMEATIETAEYGTNEKRTFVRGLRIITDAPNVFGSVSYRDNPQAAYNYTSEVGIDLTGTCLVAGGGIDTRYSRGRIRIPATTVWTYATAIEPDVTTTGSY